MDIKFVSIGFNNVVNIDKAVAVLNPDTLPSKRLISEAREARKLLDASCGRKTRAVIVMESGHLILCGLHTDTIAARLNLDTSAKPDPENEEE